MLRRTPAATRLLIALLGFACGLIGAETTFGTLRPQQPQRRPDAVVYSIEVRSDSGDLLASPMLVGEEGRPVHLRLQQRRTLRRVSLDLTPRQGCGDQLCVGYRLSLGHGVAHSGRLDVAWGEQRSVRLRGGGESLRFSLVVARARTPEFGRLLLRRRRLAT